MKLLHILSLSALCTLCTAAPTYNTGNGSSMYELTIPPHFEDDYFRSHLDQMVGGLKLPGMGFINVAITLGDVDYFPTFRVPSWEPYTGCATWSCVTVPTPSVFTPVHPTHPTHPNHPEVPEPSVMLLVGAGLLSIGILRGRRA